MLFVSLCRLIVVYNCVAVCSSWIVFVVSRLVLVAGVRCCVSMFVVLFLLFGVGRLLVVVVCSLSSFGAVCWLLCCCLLLLRVVLLFVRCWCFVGCWLLFVVGVLLAVVCCCLL